MIPDRSHLAPDLQLLQRESLKKPIDSGQEPPCSRSEVERAVARAEVMAEVEQARSEAKRTAEVARALEKQVRQLARVLEEERIASWVAEQRCIGVSEYFGGSGVELSAEMQSLEDWRRRCRALGSEGGGGGGGDGELEDF